MVEFSAQSVPYNSTSFLEFIRKLIATLRRKNFSKAMLILDNVAFHKFNEVRTLIVESGFKLMFLPPYSPFLNPIETMFSKWKNFVSRSMPNNETELFNYIQAGSTIISAEDCEGFYRKMNSYIPRCINNEIIFD